MLKNSDDQQRFLPHSRNEHSACPQLSSRMGKKTASMDKLISIWQVREGVPNRHKMPVRHLTFYYKPVGKKGTFAIGLSVTGKFILGLAKYFFCVCTNKTLRAKVQWLMTHNKEASHGDNPTKKTLKERWCASSCIIKATCNGSLSSIQGQKNVPPMLITTNLATTDFQVQRTISVGLFGPHTF